MQRKLVERELNSEGPRRQAGIGPKRRSVTVNLAELSLTWLHAHGHLEDRLYDAGERLRADWERAQLGPGVTMRWEAVRIRGTADSGLNATERQIAARDRFNAGLAAAGKGLSDVLWRVVCAGGDTALRGKSAFMAGAQRKAGAQACARAGGRLLPPAVTRPVSLPLARRG